jgi:hypothetical protein
MKLAFIGKAASSPDIGLAMDGKPAANANAPVKGKETSTKPSTPQRGQGTSKEIESEATKQSTK